MSFGRAQGSVLAGKTVNLAFSRLHLCLEKSQQSSVLLFSSGPWGNVQEPWDPTCIL